MDDEEVMLRFQRKKRRRVAALVLLAVAILGGYPLLARLPSQTYAAVLVFSALASFGLFVWIDWRCPFCEEPLGREWHYTFCPHCGTRLSL